MLPYIVSNFVYPFLSCKSAYPEEPIITGFQSQKVPWTDLVEFSYFIN